MGSAKTKLLNVHDYVVIDTETTGLSPRYDELIEIAAIRIRGGIQTHSFQTLIKPSQPIDPFIEGLTDITNEMVKDAPCSDQVIGDFLKFVGADPVLGHNVCFDISFIRSKDGEAFAKNLLFDTKRIAMHTLDCPKDLWSVKEECKRISGENINVRHHRALSDCEVTHFCYEALRPLLVDKYGEDPDAGYKRTRKRSTKKIDIDGIVQTVDFIDEDNPFYDCNICFTGKLSSMTRSEGMQYAVNAGATPQANVTKKTDYLVLGSFDYVAALNGSKSSKLKKAEKLQLEGSSLQIIDEDYYLENLPENVLSV
ncbi:MAG: exonuclease [Eggerthellaceae bacterium]|nr:exonuclease [Eggerthellaceae bacterium]